MGEGNRDAGAGTDNEDILAISEVLRGDHDAFRAIVDRYRGLVFRLALASLGAREDAEEAAQEIFLRAFRSLGTFRLGSRFLPWLYSIAANYLKTAAVKINRRRGNIVRGAEEGLAASPSCDPQAAALSAESLEQARRAVSGLPPPVREVVRLYYFEGMNVAEVGRALGIGAENVKSRLLRGRRRLREVLGGDATGGADPRYTGEGEDAGGNEGHE
jgi:RNA polymerase sigma-70 factor (ECF subfamily)